MTATTVVSLAGMSMVLAEVRYGAGRHIGDIPPESLKKGLQLNLFSQLVFLWGICFAKMSIGTSLLRIASTRFWKRTILGFSKCPTQTPAFASQCLPSVTKVQHD